MIAFVILAHQEFDSTPELLKGCYNPENLYCICINQAAITDGLSALHGVRRLPNVHVITVPPTSWGGNAVEGYLSGIDFCLSLEMRWNQLVILTNTDLPLLPRADLEQRVKESYRDRIVLAINPQLIELDADNDVRRRALVDPFKEGIAAGDMIHYNPMLHTAPRIVRQGITYALRPHAVLPAWTRNSNFIVQLSLQSNSWAESKVFTENISKFVRRGLEKFYEYRAPAFGSMWGVFPRDFCEHMISDAEALSLFALVQNAFSLEEHFFATLAYGIKFRDRILSHDIMLKKGLIDGRLSLEDVASENVVHHLFARKVPNGPDKLQFYKDVYELRNVEESLEVCAVQAGCVPVDANLRAAFRRHIRISGGIYRAGIFTGSFLSDLYLNENGAIEYIGDVEYGRFGEEWRYDETGIEVTVNGGQPFARFDHAKICGGRLLVLGEWLHAPGAFLALTTELSPLMVGPPSSAFLDTAEGTIDLCAGPWEFWFSGEFTGAVELAPDGTIRTTPNCELVGFWRTEREQLLAFGLSESPIAIFDHFSHRTGQWVAIGYARGRVAPVEPCFLRMVPACLTPEE